MRGSQPSGEDGVLELVGAIYEAALDASLWPDVLARIGDAIGGPHMLFGIYDPSTGLSNLLSPRIDPDRVAELSDWAPRNPLLPLGIGQPPGKVFTIGDFITRDEFTASAFCNDWWFPAGFDTEPLTTNLLTQHNATGILTSHHRRNRPPFDSGQKRLFAAFAEHLVRAVALQRRVHHLTLAGQDATAGFENLQQGFLLVDAQARPLFVNRQARALLDTSHDLSLDAGALFAPNADDGRHLRSLIASCSRGVVGKIGGEMIVQRPAGLSPLQILVTPIARDNRIAALPCAVNWQPSAVVLVSNPEAKRQSRIKDLRDRFGLTPAEATFALEILKGDGRKATAERLGISVGTARSHLSKIFDKTGVTRQTELIRLLLQK
jgi:DNA-binding CsgD family transcriptional regulator/GAF domain-containing protein